MKNLLLSLPFLSLISYNAVGQDSIIKHNGDKLNVKVFYLTESRIVYGHKGDPTEFSIGKPEVEKIIYKSGYTQPVSKKIVVQGANDWKNVVITYNQFDVIGLSQKGELNSQLGDRTEPRKKITDKKLFEKIQRSAAAMGGHIVYVGQDEVVASASHIAHHQPKLLVFGY